MDPRSAIWFLFLIIVVVAAFYALSRLIDGTVSDTQIRMPLKLLVGLICIAIIVWRLMLLLPM
jgi:succinate dehydrogenase hydrophobic anchor subunit